MASNGAINRASILRNHLFIELENNYNELYVLDRQKDREVFKYIYSFGANLFNSKATIESSNLGVTEDVATGLDLFNNQIAKEEGHSTYSFEPFQLRQIDSIEITKGGLTTVEESIKNNLNVISGKYLSKRQLTNLLKAEDKSLKSSDITNYIDSYLTECQALVAKKGLKKTQKVKRIYQVTVNGIYEYESIKKETKKDLNKLTGMVYNVTIDKDNGSEVLYLMDEDGTKVGNVATERNTVNFDELNGMGTSILGTWLTVNYRLKHWSNEATHHSKNYFSVTDVYLNEKPTKAQKELTDKAISYYRDAYNWTTKEPTRNPKPSAMSTVNYYDLSNSKRAKELQELLESTK